MIYPITEGCSNWSIGLIRTYRNYGILKESYLTFPTIHKRWTILTNYSVRGEEMKYHKMTNDLSHNS